MRSLVALFSIVALMAVTSTGSAQLVTNGGFETGTFAGWTKFDIPGASGVDAFEPHTGTYSAFFGPEDFAGTDLGGIFQDIVTVPGTSYSFSYWLQADAGLPGTPNVPNSFATSWNGCVINNITNVTPFSYAFQSFLVTATGTTTRISFEAENVFGFFDLDDVSVVARSSDLAVIPEPATMTLLATGLITMAGVARTRRKAGLR